MVNSLRILFFSSYYYCYSRFFLHQRILITKVPRSLLNVCTLHVYRSNTVELPICDYRCFVLFVVYSISSYRDKKEKKVKEETPPPVLRLHQSLLCVLYSLVDDKARRFCHLFHFCLNAIITIDDLERHRTKVSD